MVQKYKVSIYQLEEESQVQRQNGQVLREENNNLSLLLERKKQELEDALRDNYSL